MNGIPGIQFHVEENANNVIVGRSEIEIESRVQIKEAMIDPPREWRLMNHEPAGKCVIMKGLERLSDVENMLERAGVVDDVVLALQIDWRIEIEFQRPIRAVAIDCGY